MPENFLDKLSLTDAEVLAACAVLCCQTERPDIAGFNIKELTQDRSRYLADAAAEIMNLPDVTEDNNASFSNPAPLFFNFINKHGDLAVDTCKNFSNICDISSLVMENWHSGEQDITPLLQALKDYKDLGLQAAFYFRNNTSTQNFILNYSCRTFENIIKFKRKNTLF